MTTAPDLGSDPAAETAASVLVAARTERQTADQAGVRLLKLAVDWAAMHSVDSIEEAATFPRACFGDIAIPVAGPGAPLVAEFCVAEFAAAVNLPTETGKLFLGEAVELRYRLPRLWPGSPATSCRSGGPAGSPERPSHSHPRRQRSWTPRLLGSHTRSAPPESTD